MIIKHIKFTDYRVYNGEHTIDLTPRTKYGKRRPIVLFGGLNGAGKTTILNGIKLALYGKNSLGYSVSQKEYSEHLRSCIHRSAESVVQSNSSQLELAFTYAKMGVLHEYTVRRGWILSGSSVKESISIVEDGQEFSDFNGEQCQGFLNELIPIGVSDLFFFDGEKIAELAADTEGSILGDAIKRLVGLDLTETLSADLQLIVKSSKVAGASDKKQKEIVQLEREYAHCRAAADVKLNEWEQLRVGLGDIQGKITRLEQELSIAGGAWASSRESETVRYEQLKREQETLSQSLREILASNYPLALAGELAQKTISQIEVELEAEIGRGLASKLESRLTTLSKKLKKLLSDEEYSKVVDEIDAQLGELTAVNTTAETVHGISAPALARISSSVSDAVTNKRSEAKVIAARLDKIEEELGVVETNISRAPSESALQPLMEQLLESQKKLGERHAELAALAAERKKELWSAINLARKLEKITLSLSEEQAIDQSVLLAQNTRKFLAEFSVELSKRKVKDLEMEFARSFHRLARKEDLKYQASIDPKTFSVKLIDSSGAEVDKNDLSAGEKQIYAISVLEALARTAGRKLPVIIDTPLGRLDSIHRSKLVKNYFPYASHQVIILSTDTEVDQQFYEELSPHISHAYQLDFDSKARNTTAKLGYFWRAKNKENA